MEKFKNFLSENELFELDYIGEKFTWSNKYGDDGFTNEK